MILASHNISHEAIIYWPAIAATFGLVVFMVRLTAKVDRHGEVLTEVHDKVDQQTTAIGELSGGLHTLTAMLGGSHSGGHTHYDHTHPDS